ncbi:hypothetical protein NliqN6_0921 [Naganishia liquefaciens]|uniref:Uncharacterized protein n=1 Tax=Naganishia liquefaciens TaxID=104408 RepID=A0A8H3YCQ6_9TREE|nr:hypothetical protein NliqN6_0921 [Naganishia liquefaciens]
MYHPPDPHAEYDPNHPPALDIQAIAREGDGQGALDAYDQEQSIALYGIAGRVWDATFPIIPYLTRPSESPLEFSPGCTMFDPDAPPIILELGSGQSHASLHLLTQLDGTRRADRVIPDGTRQRPRVILTDLENVVPLVQTSVDRWRAGTASMREQSERPEVDVVALPWGDALAAERLLASGRACPVSHILMIDLIYFPHLYGRLLRTLLHLTQPPFCTIDAQSTSRDDNVGPEIILCYKTRSLEFEQTFFHAFEPWFHMRPLLSRARGQSTAEQPWRIHGRDEDVVVYICRRRRGTMENVSGWTPRTDEEVMRGPRMRRSSGARKVGEEEEEEGPEQLVERVDATVERTWGWAEAQLGAIEWE